MGRRRLDRICSHPECDRPHVAHGFCGMHYRRHQRGQDMDSPPAFEADENTVRIVRALSAQHSRTEIAEMLGCHPNTVDQIRKKHRIQTLVQRRENLVPKWVPKKLRDGFLLKLRKRGQIEAAAWARSQKGLSA